MEDLIIEGTKDTPEVSFLTNGECQLKGRSFPENPAEFYKPLMDWANSFAADKVTLNVHLDYFNTATSKMLYNLLDAFAKPDNKEFKINWYYEENDEDSLEMGQHYASMVTAPFTFIPYQEES